MKGVVTFGEIMLRLSPPGFQRFEQARKYDVFFGGGEANVASSLANFGLETTYVTKLPKNDLGKAAANELRRYGVNIDKIVWDEGRLGIYFCEKGASMRPSFVLYDRADSSMAKSQTKDFVWEAIFKDAQWFHFTGITPALGPQVAEVCMEACKAAKKLNVKVSCDLNFRKNLWSSNKAKEVMTKLMPFVDVLIVNEEDAEKVFGIKAENTNIEEGFLDVEGYKAVAEKLISLFGFELVAITLRESISANDNGWSGILFDGKQFFQGPTYEIRIVDRVGGGDSFCAGLIYSLISGFELQYSLDFAVSASALKHTIEGDFNLVGIEEVTRLLEGGKSGRVQR
jgi:2-dehydro-3-deoxygluconokinase